MKKVLGLILSLSIVIGLLTSFTTVQAATDASKLEPYELNCYFLAAQQKDQDAVQNEINKQLTKKINATIKLNFLFWDNYSTKIDLNIASGEPMDTAFTASWYGYSNNVAKNAFLELDNLLTKYAPETKKQINSAYLKAPRIEGKLYAIPTEKELAAAYGVVVKKALVDKYKFDLSKVKKPEDFEKMFSVIKAKEKGIIPFLASSTNSPVWFSSAFYEHIGDTQIPGSINKFNGKTQVVNEMDSPEYIKLLKLTRKWFLKGYINKDAATIKDQSTIEKEGRFFMEPQQLKPGKADELSQSYGYKLLQVGAYDVKPYIGTGDATNSMTAIPSTSKDPARAMMFINLMHTDATLMNLLAWGIPNKNYVKKNANQIDFPAGVTAETSGYNHGMQWTMGNQMLDYLWANENPKKWALMKEFNNSAITSKIIGFNYNSESVFSKEAAVKTVFATYMPAIACGSVDYLKYWDRMKSMMESAGLKDVLAEKQKQVNEYLKLK